MFESGIEVLRCALIMVKERGPMDKTKGICANAELYANYGNLSHGHRHAFKTTLGELCLKWPNRYVSEFIHNNPYPVGGMQEYYTAVEAGTVWQNPRRLEFLDWLIEFTSPLAGGKAE